MTAREPILLVKIGGSIVTDKAAAGGVRTAALRRFARAVSASRATSRTNLVVALGGGSIGHRAAARYGLGAGEAFLPAQVHRMSKAMFLLKCRLAEALEGAGVAALPFHETSTLVADEAQVACQGDAILQGVRSGFVPILSGGPVLSSLGGMIAFNSDRLAHSLLASGSFKVERFILFCDAPGVIGTDGRIIAELSPANVGNVADLGLPTGVVDVSGGMKSKVAICLDLARLGVESIICGPDALEVQPFSELVAGGSCLGTRIRPAASARGGHKAH